MLKFPKVLKEVAEEEEERAGEEIEVVQVVILEEGDHEEKTEVFQKVGPPTRVKEEITARKKAVFIKHR